MAKKTSQRGIENRGLLDLVFKRVENGGFRSSGEASLPLDPWSVPLRIRG